MAFMQRVCRFAARNRIGCTDPGPPGMAIAPGLAPVVYVVFARCSGRNVPHQRDWAVC